MIKINEKNTSIMVEILSVFLFLFIGYVLFLNNLQGLNRLNGSDVHYGFQRGVTILQGGNPYNEFNMSSMLDQEKVPGFFPLYFYFMAAVTKISNSSFVLFIDNLRLLVFFCYSSLGLLIYSLLRKQSKMLATMGMILFMFNRWTLGLGLKQDTYVLFILLTSMILLHKDKYKYLSFLLFGIATAIKHITVFAFPVYFMSIAWPLFESLRNKNRKNILEELKKAIVSFLIILAPILLPSIYFIQRTPDRFFYSLMFNVTRTSEEAKRSGFDNLLVLYNQDANNSNFYYMLPRIPMVVALTLALYLLFTKKVGYYKYCAIAYFIFIAFNPTLFNQYFVWFTVFFPLSFLKE